MNNTRENHARQEYLRSLDLATRAAQFTPSEHHIRPEDLDLLMRHCVCDAAFFTEARELLLPHYFQPNEMPAKCAWYAMCARYPHFTTDGLIGEIHNYLRSGDPEAMLSPLQVELMTGPESRISQWLNTPPEQLDYAGASEILRRFVRQRGVIAPIRRYISNHGPGLDPADVEHFLQHALEQSQSLEAAFLPQIRTLGEAWDEHESRLAITRGRRLVGLETGFPQLDEKLLGMRGLTLLGAMPSVGKTALCLQIGLGVCQAHAVNDAVVVIFSLEMSKDELTTRLKCMLSGLDWRTYVLGSPGYRDGGQVVFTSEHQQQIQRGRQRMVDEQIGQRLCILDRSHVGDELTASMIHGMVSRVKSQVGASRALVIIDYLQLLATGNAGQSDLEADKQRIRLLQDVVVRSKTEANPLGDAVIGISEARKPAGTAETKRKNAWGQGLAELMGSARLGYGADAVLLYRRMTDEDIKQHYNIEGHERIEQHYQALERDGISPIVLTVEKGRDGTTRGEIPMEFYYRRLTFQEYVPVRPCFPERVPTSNGHPLRPGGNGLQCPTPAAGNGTPLT